MSVKYKDILGMLKELGLSSTKLRSKHLLSESTLSRIRRDDAITTDAIDIICNLLHCQPNDIMEIQYDHIDEEERDAIVDRRRKEVAG